MSEQTPEELQTGGTEIVTDPTDDVVEDGPVTEDPGNPPEDVEQNDDGTVVGTVVPDEADQPTAEPGAPVPDEPLPANPNVDDSTPNA